jgi:hypothetical protein
MLRRQTDFFCGVGKKKVSRKAEPSRKCGLSQRNKKFAMGKLACEAWWQYRPVGRIEVACVHLDKKDTLRSLCPREKEKERERVRVCESERIGRAKKAVWKQTSIQRLVIGEKVKDVWLDNRNQDQEKHRKTREKSRSPRYHI